jgi:NCK-associated protein 1
MSTKWAEKSVVLIEQTDVLLDQAYNIKATLSGEPSDAQPDILQKRFKGLAGTLVKRFPALCNTEDLSKADDALLQASAADMVQQLEPYVDCFAAVEEVGREIATLLVEITNQSVLLDWSVNVDLCKSFFTLLTRYAKLNILTAGLHSADQAKELVDNREFRKKCRVILAAYAKASEALMQHDERYTSTAQYLLDFDDPIHRMQENFKMLSPKLGQCVENLAKHMMGLINWDVLQGGQLFSVQSLLLMETMESLPSPEDSELYANLFNFAESIEWMLYSFIICPADLSDTVKLEVLKNCLSEGASLPIYRDEYLDVHEVMKGIDKVYRIDKLYHDLVKGKKSANFSSDAKHEGGHGR